MVGYVRPHSGCNGTLTQTVQHYKFHCNEPRNVDAWKKREP